MDRRILFSPDEIADMQARVTVIQTRLYELKREIATFEKPRKDEIKDIEAETQELTDKVKTGFRFENQEVYHFVKPDKGVTEIYGNDGVMITSMPLSSERQTSLLDDTHS